MRVLIVTPEFPPHSGGGILKFYALLADALVRGGAAVTVLVASAFSSFDDYDTAAGARVRFTKVCDVQREWDALARFAAAPGFRKYLAAANVAAAHVTRCIDEVDVIETTDFGLLFAPILALENRPPVLVRMHGSLGQISEHEPTAPGAELDGALFRLIESTVLPFADRLVAYSPANAAEWAHRVGGTTEVGWTPPPMAWPEQPARKESGYSGVVAARIQSWKGPEMLCEALARAGQDLPGDMKIAWLGRDTHTAEGGLSMSASLAARYPDVWGSRIVPAGPKDASTVAAYMAGVRYAVVPSLWDTFNFTVAEAMATGLPTIASGGAGAVFLIDNGTNGFSYEATDASMLADRLFTAHRLSDFERAAMGAAAQGTVRTRMAHDVVAAGAVADYRAVMAAEQRRLPDWVRDFMCGQPDTPVPGDAFLETVSIRTLATHLASRLNRKLRNR